MDESECYSLEEVKRHNTASSLWVLRNNFVYNVTDFVDEHPGGRQAIEEFAGQDISQVFEEIGHSDHARQLLDSFKIGELRAEDRVNSAPEKNPKCSVS